MTLDWHLIGLEDFHGIAVGSLSSSVETLGFANWELCAIIHPPSRLGTNPHRGLVPWLSAGMALSNGKELAWDWPIGLGLADWHWIGTGLADWHGLARIG